MNIEKVKLRWASIPESYRFIIVGSFGVALGWLIYNIIFFLMPELQYKATLTWSIAYILAIFRQHALHFFFTFKESESSYYKSLIGAFSVYGAGWFLTTGVNSVLISVVKMNHQIAFFVTVGSGVVFNYFFLKKVAFR